MGFFRIDFTKMQLNGHSLHRELFYVTREYPFPRQVWLTDPAQSQAFSLGTTSRVSWLEPNGISHAH